ncbi:MAG: hypothetical protein IPJ30_04585, partial [Acidobacteria bacterium]|nr:hypothetical protein [Acidobacteriota bacterium]
MDPILTWNAIALDANKMSFSNPNNENPGPTMSSRALGIVHLAMYDAFAAVSGNPAGLPPYMPSLPPAPSGATTSAAVATAAHHALSSLYPSQKSNFDTALASFGNPADPGHSYGFLIAGEILRDRSGDGNASDAGYVPPTGPGKHQPDPDSDSREFHAPFYGAVTKTFAVTDPNRHRILPPYGLTSSEYRDAV